MDKGRVKGRVKGLTDDATGDEVRVIDADFRATGTIPLEKIRKPLDTLDRSFKLAGSTTAQILVHHCTSLDVKVSVPDYSGFLL